MKFVVLGLPRSGTHMLASAINSHPDVVCRMEDEQPVFADIAGRVWTKLEEVPPADKYIVIHRPFKDRMRSFRYTGYSHRLTPGPRPEEPMFSHIGIEDEGNQLRLIAITLGALQLEYNELTGNSDCRALSVAWSNVICDFLGVYHKVLCPLTHKPQDVVPRV